MKKFLFKLAGCQMAAMFAAWVFFCFWQVLSQNCMPDPVYSAWNFLTWAG